MAATQSGPRTTGEILNPGFPSQENSDIKFPEPVDRFPNRWCNSEEAHGEELIDLETAWNELAIENKIFLIVRCVMTFLCFVAIIGMFVGIGRSRRFRYKSWRLYMFTSILVLTWMCLSLYYDHIDRNLVSQIYLHPQRDIIYTCIMNLVQGMSLFLIVLLLSHLSDFQHRGSWLWLIALVVVVPGVYSIVLLLVELFGLPQKCETNVGDADLHRNSFAVSTAKITIKVAFYNVATIILLVVFSRNLCTKRLYGTYSEHRSPLAVLISRWTFAFLILHNLTEIASYGALIASKGEVCTYCLDVAYLVEGILKEVSFLFILLAVPCSYLIAFLAHCVLGVDDESTLVEMEKIDKVYQEDFPDLLGSEVSHLATTRTTSI